MQLSSVHVSIAHQVLIPQNPLSAEVVEKALLTADTITLLQRNVRAQPPFQILHMHAVIFCTYVHCVSYQAMFKPGYKNATVDQIKVPLLVDFFSQHHTCTFLPPPSPFAFSGRERREGSKRERAVPEDS